MKEFATRIARDVSRRAARSLLTVAAMAAGSATLISVVAVNDTAARNLVSTVSALQSDAVRISMPARTWDTEEFQLTERALRTGIVERIGTFVDKRSGSQSVAVCANRTVETVQVDTVVASAAGLRARGARVLEGASVDPNDLAAAGAEAPPSAPATQDSVLLGSALAAELALSTEIGANTFLLDGRRVWVRGIVRDAPKESALASAIVLTPGSARRIGVLPDERTMLVVARQGALRELTAILPTTMYPAAPDAVSVNTELSPDRFRARLLAGSESLVRTMVGVSTGAAAIGVATTMLVAVRERRREIGIVRAMGESRASVWRRFLGESIALGLVGGTIGWMVGVFIGDMVAVTQGSPFSLPPWTFAVLPMSGVLAAIAGSVPAWAASRVAPAALLRAE